MKEATRRKLGKRAKYALAVAPVLLAVAVVVLLARTRPGPSRREHIERVRPLRVINVPAVELVPKSFGYGLAGPARVWQAVAEVGGRAVFVSPNVQPGRMVEKGETLLRIDPSDYELAVARLRASIAEARARMRELDAEERNRQASLEIERQSLALAETSLARLRENLERGVVPPDEVDREERNVLQQRQAIQEIENALATLPSRRDALEAALEAHEANLKQAELDLERTVVRSPFNCRLGDARLQEGQYVNAGQVLFDAHGTDAMEIEASFRPEQLRALLPPERRGDLDFGMSMEALRELLDLTVAVRMRSGDWEAVWEARFDRIREVVDPRTRAIKVVATVEDPFGKVVPGVRPALTSGMYCEVELRAPPRPRIVVVPRGAVRDGHVYVLDGEGRLRSRPVQTGRPQSGFVIVESGLSGGETVVVSDPAPAIEGMKVDPVPDDDLRRAIVEQAEGVAR